MRAQTICYLRRENMYVEKFAHGHLLSNPILDAAIKLQSADPVARSSCQGVEPHPFNAADLLAQEGQVLSELHHCNDERARHQRACGPEERANDGPAAIETCQEDTVLLL